MMMPADSVFAEGSLSGHRRHPLVVSSHGARGEGDLGRGGSIS